MKIAVGITGASGSIYAQQLLLKLGALQDQIHEVGVVFSSNAKDVWKFELENEDYNNIPFKVYEKSDFFAPFASGSAGYDTVIICPCSMGTMGRIAGGISDDLITRAADVALKERRKLILMARDTPYNLIHLKNMTSLTEAGAIICPATPSFYSRPKSMEELALTVVDRILDLAGLNQPTFRWASNK
ncbi:MAG: UbiX family flavin prenyltransferase [Bacteroidia bacterium]